MHVMHKALKMVITIHLQNHVIKQILHTIMLKNVAVIKAEVDARHYDTYRRDGIFYTGLIPNHKKRAHYLYS